MTTKTWNAVLAIVAALAVSAAILSFVLRSKEKTELVRARQAAEAETRSERQAARDLKARQGFSKEDEALRQRIAEMRDRMVADADALTKSLEAKSASDQARRELELRLQKLQEDIATATDSVDSSTALEAELARREGAWQKEKAELLKRLERGLERPTVVPPSTEMAAIVQTLLADSKSTEALILGLASSEPALDALADVLVDEDRATAALQLLQHLEGFSRDRLLPTAAWFESRSDFQRSTWLDTWLGLPAEPSQTAVAAAQELPKSFQVDLIARTKRGNLNLAEALELSEGLIDGPEGEAALASLTQQGFRPQILAQLQKDLKAALAQPVWRRYLLAGPEALSDLVELAQQDQALLPVLAAALPQLIDGAKAKSNLRELSLIISDYELVRQRLSQQNSSLMPWPAGELFVTEREALQLALAGSLDVVGDPRALALAEPNCFDYGAAGQELRQALLAAKTDAALAGAIKIGTTSRRFRLAGLAQGLQSALLADGPIDHYSRALRADGHEFVEAFLWKQVREFSPAESAEVAILSLQKGRKAAATVLEALLESDIAGRMTLLERLFSLGPQGLEIASSIAAAADGRAVFRLVELSLEQNQPLPKPVIETILRSPVIDFDRRDVYMAAFRMALGDEFRGVLHAALMDADSPRKDVLLEDLALPADLALRPLIVRFLEAENAGLRESALRVLCHYPSADLIDRLALLSRDPDALVRVQLARCFARTLDEVARGILMTMTRDTSAFVREAAALGLAAHRGTRVTPILRERLNDDVAEVRVAAARALLAQGQADAVEALIAELKTPIVSEFVAIHLNRRFGKSFASAAAWLDWWDSDGRQRFGLDGER